MDITQLDDWFNKTMTSFTSYNITKLAPGAFSLQRNLESVIVPNVTVLSSYCFYECEKLSTLSTGNLTKLDNYCLCGCSSLIELDVSHVINVEQTALSGNTNLKVLDFASVKNISYGAIWTSYCDKIWIPSTCTYIGPDNFFNKPSGVNTKIYTDAPSKPSNWDNNWNRAGLEVVWGSTHEQFEAA